MDNIQAEIEILGRIIRNPKTIYMVNDHLRSEDFQNLKNQSIYESMKTCGKLGQPIEVGIIMNHLQKSGVTISDLVQMSGSVASTSDIKHYVDIVKESSKKRKLKGILAMALERADNDSYDDLSNQTIKNLYSVGEDTNIQTHVDRSQLMSKVLDFLEEGIKSGGNSVGMKSGWDAIDKPLKGFNPGDLTLLGARPSMGKTVFSLNLADRLSTNNKVLFFELEMQDYKLGLRELAARSNIPLNRLYEPHNLTDEEFSTVNATIAQITNKGNLVIDDSPRITLDYIRRKIHFLKETQGVDVVFIDHIGLIKMEKGFSSRNDWLGEVSGSLKAMAKEFNVAMIVLSQLSRGIDNRNDKRPILSDLRDSGNLEQDADCVIFLYRDGYYLKDEKPEIESLEVIIAKNRDGMTGQVNMAISLGKQLVTEIYEGDPNPWKIDYSKASKE